MAEAALLGVVAEGVLKKVGSLLAEEMSLLWGFKQQLNELRESLNMIRAVLHDAVARQVQEVAVKLWLKKLKDVAYAANDALEEFAYEILRHKVEIKSQLTRKVRCCFSSSNPILFRVKMAHKINNINGSLEKINKEAIDFGLQRGGGGMDVVPGQVTTLSRESDSFLDNSRVVGRDEDASKIVEMLIGAGNKEEEVLSVIPIVGMGGLGKTTLAKLIYKDEHVMRYFEVRIWICVSVNFDTKRLLVEILESLGGTKCEVQSRDVILRDLEKVLGGKKYLLVLDDVWDDNALEWDDFKSCLLGVSTNKGNNIVVTTRKQGVASITGTCQTHYLEGLSEDDCLSIFKQKAFAAGGATMTPELEAIGIEMVKKCRGVPLAAKVLGAMMFSKKERHEWLAVQESVLCCLSGDEKGVLDILKLSFDNLPSPSSKQCFAYCSITAKDCNIEKANLIQLWMAVGLLELEEGSDKAMEDTGSEIFNVLLQSSLFQDVRKDQYDNIIGCKMHDLVHDLAQSISKFESFTSEDSVVIDIPPVRHLALYSSRKTICPILSREKARYLHTLILNSDVPNLLSDFKYLRVLTLKFAGIRYLPNSIGKLIHLRYLDLSGNPIKHLPKSIGKLYNLQTLRIHNDFELPDELSYLVGLRHLHFNGNYTWKMSPGMGRLTCLQTLKSFHVGREKGRRIEELGCLKNIRGEITIHNLAEVNSREEAQRADLFGKKNLYKLVLDWTGVTGVNSTNDEEVLEGLQPHPNLKSLSINGFSGDKFPLWMMNVAINIDGRGSSLPLNNLVDISLQCCKRCEHIPMFGHLPHLRDLELRAMGEVKCIDASSNGHHSIASTSSISCGGSETPVLFPALVSLSLCNMLNLEEWMEADGVLMFPCLEELRITDCPKLTTFPSRFPCLKKLFVIDVNSSLLPNVLANDLITLRDLVIESVPELTSLPGELWQKNKYLTTLHITDCAKLSSLPDGFHTLLFLEKLKIWYCDNLNCIPSMQGLTSLRDLSIRGCEGLTRLPSGMLQSCTSLQTLKIVDCNNLSCLPELGCLTRLNTLGIGSFAKELDSFPHLDGLQNLQSCLGSLTLSGRHKWESIPGPLQHLTALTKLSLYEFGVEALPEWFGNFSRLKHLEIRKCKKLKYLHSIERLNNFESLWIYNCPLLKETYHEWSKTAPYRTNIKIDSITVKWPNSTKSST